MKISVEIDRFLDKFVCYFSPQSLFRDLIFIFFWLMAAIAFIYIPYLNQSFLRVVFALPVVLFIPGYALIAALFPGKGDIDGIERIALSFGLSIAVVPLIGLALNYTPWGIRLDPIVTSLVIFTAVMLVVAQYRRADLAEEERFVVPVERILDEARMELFPEKQNRTDRILSIVLIISIVFAVGTTVFFIVLPKEGEKFTEFYILGEKGMAADYPTRFFAGTDQELIIGIGNHEYDDKRYFVEVFGINQEFDELTNSSSINSMMLLDRITVDVKDNSTEELDYTFTIDDQQINKLQLLLFMDSYPPESIWGQERINASYRDLHLWVDMREPLKG